MDENRWFDKIAGSDFEQPKAGPEGAEYRDVFRNPDNYLDAGFRRHDGGI